jgi:2-phospho-L-lactate transferase/gluconeogenesis factor (CofD/UPF0052 family)
VSSFADDAGPSGDVFSYIDSGVIPVAGVFDGEAALITKRDFN